MRQLKSSSAFILISLLVFLYHVPIFSSTSNPAESTIIDGVVTDVTNFPEIKPIQNASIVAISSSGSIVGTSKTDELGYYNLALQIGGDFSVLAYCDYPNTEGFDYLPAVRTISVATGQARNCSFWLTVGASIILEGDPLLVETTEPIEQFTVVVIDPRTGRPPSMIMGIFLYSVYGDSTFFRSYNTFMNIDPKHIVVPANRSVSLNVNLKPSQSDETFTINVANGTQPFFLRQGDLVRVDIEKITLERDLGVTEALINEANKLLEKAESSGLYVVAERNRLSQAASLTSSARELLSTGSPESRSKCFADLREAYIIASYMVDSIKEMLAAYQSTFAILPFLAFTSVIVAFLIFDDPRRKWSLALSVYGLLLLVIWLTLPGFRLTDPRNTLIGASLSFAAAIFVTVFLPRQYGEKADETGIMFQSAVVSAFSMAKRSMRRRRLRSVLTLTSIITMIWAFTVLTSVSLEYGLVTERFPRTSTPGEGILIDNSPAELGGYFRPVSESMLEWLRTRHEVKFAAPKAESYPQAGFAKLSIQGNGAELSINGWLGFVPSVEANVTGFDRLISAGRFLSDNDEDAILISEGAAAILNATGQLKLGVTRLVLDVGYPKSFVLVGLMKDNLLNGFRDFDGASIMPKQQISGAPLPLPCSSESIIVMPFNTALTLPSTVISRIDVILRDGEDLKSFARQVVLEKGYEAWVSLNGEITHWFVGSYAEYKVASLSIPLSLVIVNIGVMMIGTMYERRRESVILSVIGLNPSHIIAIYIAEALILGVVGGSLGYLAGIASYRIMALLHIAIEVKQKVSINWSIAAVGLSVLASVIASAIPATRAPKMTLPSLKFRWKFGEKTVKKPSAEGMPWIVKMPAKIPLDKSQSFFNFLISSMKKYYGGSYESVRGISLKEEGREKVRLTFQYAYGQGIFPVTYNELVATLDKKSNSYSLELRCNSPARSTNLAREKVYMTASFVRKLVLEWTGIALKKEK